MLLYPNEMNGNTLLHMAVRHILHAIAIVLIQAGANRNALNVYDDLPTERFMCQLLFQHVVVPS